MAAILVIDDQEPIHELQDRGRKGFGTPASRQQFSDRVGRDSLPGHLGIPRSGKRDLQGLAVWRVSTYWRSRFLSPLGMLMNSRPHIC